MSKDNLTDIYNLRFRNGNSSQKRNRNNAWIALYQKILKKHVIPTQTILDLGSGPGYFCNQIEDALVYAVDLDKSNSNYLSKTVKFHCTSSQQLDFAADDSFDLVFTSNLFEHLGSSESLIKTLCEVHRILSKKSSSKLIVLMPNIRYTKWDFYNFVDHNLPLNEKSLMEALELCGFKVLEMHKKFFPYTANETRITIPSWLINLYLTLPPSFRPMAKQMFVVATPINRN